MKYLAIILSVALPASVSRAQASPGIITPAARSLVFDITRLPFSTFGTHLDTVSCQKLTTDPPGIYTVCLTVGGLTSAYGGNGRRLGVLIGKYDIRVKTFNATTEANLLNDVAYHHYNLHIEPGAGLLAVCDRLSAAQSTPLDVMLSVRTSATVAFPAPVRIAGIQGTIVNGFDASVGRIGGVPHLFYMATIANQQGIWIDALDLTNPALPRVLGQPRVVVANTPAWTNVHSPSPLAGPDGDVEGLLCALRINPGFSDMAFAEDLNPVTPPLLTLTGSKNNGGVAGGTFLCADSGLGYFALSEATGSWLLGDDEVRGGIANFLAGAPGGTANNTALFLSIGVAPPLQIPGIYGALGISLSPILTLGTAAHNVDDLATLSFQIPNDPALAGKSFAVQGFTFATTPPAVFAFTNTAWLSIR